MSRACVIGILVLSTAGIASAADREGARHAAAQDVNAQLLQEVRRLREAIEMMVSTGARVQIVFGRLQLQEQRTATAVRRLDELRETLARVTQQVADFAQQGQDLDERQREFRGTPEERAELEAERKHFRRAVDGKEAERQRVQAEESQAAATLANEQARWASLNQQLEELERALTKGR